MLTSELERIKKILMGCWVAVYGQQLFRGNFDDF